MARFKYKAINARGEIIEGEYEGESQEEVIKLMSSNNYSPLRINEVTRNRNIKIKVKKTIRNKEIAIFCRQLSTMINAGVSIITAMDILKSQVQNKKFKIILEKINEDIQKGEDLSSAMGKFNEDFPRLLISMIEVGERSGNLDAVMERMAAYYEKQHKLNGKLRNAMIYPAVLGGVTVVVIGFLLTYVMPMFIGMFEESSAKLPAPTRIVLGLSDSISNYGVILLLLILIVIFGLHYYFTSVEAGIYSHSYFKLKQSPFKRLNQKTIVSRFARGLSTVIGAGMSLSNSLDIVCTVVDNRYAEKQLKLVIEKVISGYSLADAVMESRLFPPMLSSMMKIGEESGKLDSILEKTADFYDDELERAIEGLTAILDPIMLVIMGGIIAFLIVSIITPMFQMYNVM